MLFRVVRATSPAPANGRGSETRAGRGGAAFEFISKATAGARLDSSGRAGILSPPKKGGREKKVGERACERKSEREREGEREREKKRQPRPPARQLASQGHAAAVESPEVPSWQRREQGIPRNCLAPSSCWCCRCRCRRLAKRLGLLLLLLLLPGGASSPRRSRSAVFHPKDFFF